MSHYLSISYKSLITNKNFHNVLFILECYLIMLQILEIHCNNFRSFIRNNIISFSPLTKLLLVINSIPNNKTIIAYAVIIIIATICIYIPNLIRLRLNIFTKILINITDLLFCRILSLFIFNFLFLFTDIYLLISILISLPYLIGILYNFLYNHLYFFFPKIINYPYDTFSMIIDLHFLFIKICLSISSRTLNINMSKFFFSMAIFILFTLLFYLLYIMIYKSYYLMNNSSLNKVRYSAILCLCLIFLFVMIIGRNDIYNMYSFVCYCNFLLLSLIIICYFYDPYKFAKFYKDDNIENTYYYFFILDRNKNKYLLLEKTLENHLSKCPGCNLCKKYKSIEFENKNESIDLYHIIYGSKDIPSNLMNELIRRFKKYGKSSFGNNSYYLINIIYAYYISLKKKNCNSSLNFEILYEIINNENSEVLDEYKICLKRIQISNKFIFKSKKILDLFSDILEEKKQERKIQKFFKLAELLNELKYKEIKKNINSNGSDIEKLPNCNNLLTISSLFYEELYNKSTSNSGIYIKDSISALEDLINNNNKNSRQITLEINIQSYTIKIIRGGGGINKYENSDLTELFPSIFKNNQMKEMKKILLNSNNNYKGNNRKAKKGNKREKQYLHFEFIIEEKEDTMQFYRILKLKLTLFFIENIDVIIYLDGLYNIDKDIIVTEEKKDEEILVNFGNKEQMDSINYDNNNKIFIQSSKNNKYLGKKRLIKDNNFFVGSKKYNIYHFLSNIKKNNFTKTERLLNKSMNTEYQDEKSNIDASNKLMIYNELASQASSTTSSISRNNLVSLNRGTKKNKNSDDIRKEFKISKYILFACLFILLISIFLEYIYMINIQKKFANKNELYLFLEDYKVNFYMLFCSILSLTCLGNTTDSYSCIKFVEEITRKEMNAELSKRSNKTDTNNISDVINGNNESEFVLDLDYLLNNIFLDLTKILFAQNQILSQNLQNRLQDIIKYLSSYDDKKFMNNNFKKNVTYYKIYQDAIEGQIILSLKNDSISFEDFMLLMTSRCGILTKNYEDIKNPIYILNKTGEYVFNNIYLKEKLNIYQQNIYLLILDFRAFSDNYDLVIFQFGMNIYDLKIKIKSMVYIIWSLNLFLIFIIILLIFGYISMYFVIIYNLLNGIINNLNEKIGETLIKDYMKRKIDNLKLLLSFYDRDINETITELNSVYSNYRENCNQKIKEESKFLRREGKIGAKRKNIDCLKSLKTIKKNNILNYSGKKNLYVYSFLFIIIINLLLFSYIIVVWELFFAKETSVSQWVMQSETVCSATYRLMTSLYIMAFNNKTLNDISQDFGTQDFIALSYNDIYNLYGKGKYFNSVLDLIVFNVYNIPFECSKFYEQLNNSVYDKLMNQFSNQLNQLSFTMNFFCEWSQVMKFKNYKTIYLQIFNRVKIAMEDFKNKKYSDLVDFICDINIIKIETVFLITYAYLFDIMYTNIKSCVKSMITGIKNNIIMTSIIYVSLLAFLIISIFFIFIRNVHNDSKHLIKIKKIFKVCNINE